MSHVHTFTLAVVVSATVFLSACNDDRKASEQAAVDELNRLAPVLKEDIAQVRRGLPQGAAKLASLLDPDTLANTGILQHAVARARAEVRDLAMAKSTFFSYADETGTFLRSEADPDLLAGQSMVRLFPDLKKALMGAPGVTEAYGDVKDLRMAKTGPELIWAAAAPVTDGKGRSKGMFVTGWSFRALAYHLETTAKMEVAEASKKKGKKLAPLLYIYVVKGQRAYGAPSTPDVNAKALEALDVPGKTAAGPYRGALEITGRTFGVAGSRVPEMGDDAALAVIASEI